MIADLSMSNPADTRARIVAILQEIGAREVLDIGCGHGALAKSLCRDGFHVTGLDPSAEAIAAATTRVPGATFVTAGAEALPFAPASFDAAIFLNALHHVPVPDMLAALKEALRVLRPNGEVIIVEPLAEGSFFEVMRPVEDETEIREAAQRAIDDILAQSQATGPAPVIYERATPMPDLEAFIDYLSAVDPARRALAEGLRHDLARLFAQNVVNGPTGQQLVQPLKIWRLRGNPG